MVEMKKKQSKLLTFAGIIIGVFVGLLSGTLTLSCGFSESITCGPILRAIYQPIKILTRPFDQADTLIATKIMQTSFWLYYILLFGLIGLFIVKLFEKRKYNNAKSTEIILIFIIFFILTNFLSPISHAYPITNSTNQDSHGVVRPMYPNPAPFYTREVFADIPWRIQPDESQIPVYFVVKDADTFLLSYALKRVEIWQDTDNDEIVDRHLKTANYTGIIGDEKYNMYENGDWYDIIWLPKQGYDVNNDFYSLSGKIHLLVIIYGSFKTTHKFTVIVDSKQLPKFERWFCGDTHYHSSYTDNMYEFGASIEATVAAAEAIGLDWFTVTDHSFDLDSGTETGKWSKIKEDCDDYSTSSIKCLLGEEISCKWSNGQFSHYLGYNLQNYIEGEGMNGYSWAGNEPGTTDYCYNVVNRVNNDNSESFGYVAHPIDDGGGASSYRDPWHEEGYDYAITGIEIWNGKHSTADLENGLTKWKDLLLKGKTIFIEAGSDAHGDFNHIHASSLSLPTWDDSNEDNAFGKVITCCYASSLTQSNIFNSLENGNCYMSDNGLLKFEIDGDRENKAILGEKITICSGDEIRIQIDYDVINSCDLEIWKGYLTNPPQSDEIKAKDYDWVSNFDSNIVYDSLTNNAYYRAECVDSSNNLRIYTNPIWVNVDTSDPDDDDICDTYDLCPTVYGTEIDSDNDGLLDVDEFNVCLCNPDCDYDGANDNMDLCVTVPGPICNGYCPDEIPPVSTITSHKNNSYIFGTIELKSLEIDNCSVILAEYKIDQESWSFMNLSGNQSSTLINTSLYADGQHIIYVRGTDEYNNTEQTASITVTFDNTPPNITFLSPLNNSINKPTVFLNITTDENATCYYSLDGEGFMNFSYDENAISFSELMGNLTKEADIPLYRVEINCTDIVGNSIKEFINFYIDLPPLISLNPAPDYIRDVVWLYANFSDHIGLETPCEICISEDSICDTEWTSDNVTTNFSSGNLTGQCIYNWNTTNLADGNYTTGFRVKDTINNTASNQTTTIVDNTQPVLSIVNPLNGSTISGDDVWFNVSTDEITTCYVSDSYEYFIYDTEPPLIYNATPTQEQNGDCPIQINFITNELSECKGNIDYDAGYEEMNITFYREYYFQENMYWRDISISSENRTNRSVTIYVKCKDLVGNVMPSSYNWTFDVYYPPLPTPGCGFSFGPFGTPAHTLPDKYHELLYNITDAYVYFREVTCNDLAGNFNKSNTLFSVDNSAPQITINKPEKLVHDTLDIQFNVSINEVGICNYSLNNETNTTLFSNNTGAEITLHCPKGSNTIKVYCSDYLGHRNESQLPSFDIVNVTHRDLINATANKTSTINSTEETDSVLELLTSTNLTNANINITEYIQNPKTKGTVGLKELGKFLLINASEEIENNIEWVLIRVYYTQKDIDDSGIEEDTLKLYHWNETLNEWTVCENTGVNVTANYVWANVTHFSYYGSFGSIPAQEPPTQEDTKDTGGGSSGGGSSTTIQTITCTENWTCTEWNECIAGIQTRTCTDQNDCETEKNKPSESRSCETEGQTEEIPEEYLEEETNETIIEKEEIEPAENATDTTTPTGFAAAGILQNPLTLGAAIIIIAIIFWLRSKSPKKTKKKSKKNH